MKFNYITDNDLFNAPSDEDFWQNHDYYLTHKRTGDCEDFSVAFALIHEAKGISAQIIGVRMTNDQYYWIVEYEFNSHIRYADINKNNVIIYQDSNPWVDTKFVAINKDIFKYTTF